MGVRSIRSSDEKQQQRGAAAVRPLRAVKRGRMTK
ncbi:hypothetical protein T260_02940 [Geobacillus thermopakistaniensis]|uniref:Uncharacterized protein n=1 Tax=Geobacillus thermopakistaniensis (strain MAS1) TaxID=1408282 RepID=A0A7U9JDB7_GEOTM|nr:hypothetical protein T260_02940 [Geobacillus sp. MAS1]